MLNFGNAMLSALYLLTADRFLWSKVGKSINSKKINFSAVHLGNVSHDAYTLFMTARDLYEGTKHITISDIDYTEIISHKMFGIICNVMTIRRYCMNAVSIIEKDCDGRYRPHNKECKTPYDQFYYANVGGLSCKPDNYGKVMGQFLNDGEKTNFHRDDFLGIINKQYLPEWAKEMLAELESPKPQRFR